MGVVSLFVDGYLDFSFYIEFSLLIFDSRNFLFPLF